MKKISLFAGRVGTGLTTKRLEEQPEKKWRRGQDSNLHSLSAGGFQDRCTTIMRPLRILAEMNITQRRLATKMMPRACRVEHHDCAYLRLNFPSGAEGVSVY
jgi:hypothetical protein